MDLHNRRIKIEEEVRGEITRLDKSQVVQRIKQLPSDELRTVMMSYLNGQSQEDALVKIEVSRRLKQINKSPTSVSELIFGKKI